MQLILSSVVGALVLLLLFTKSCVVVYSFENRYSTQYATSPQDDAERSFESP